MAGFAERVLDKIRNLDALDEFPVHAQAIRKLAETYSAAQEGKDLQLFMERMGL